MHENHVFFQSTYCCGKQKTSFGFEKTIFFDVFLHQTCMKTFFFNQK